MTNEELEQCVCSLNEEIKELKHHITKLYGEAFLLDKRLNQYEDNKKSALNIVKTLKKALEQQVHSVLDDD